MENFRNFLEFLESKQFVEGPVGKLAQLVMYDVTTIGNASCFHIKPLNLAVMTRYLMSRNAPRQSVEALKGVFNEWRKYEEDERKSWEAEKAANKLKFDRLKNK